MEIQRQDFEGFVSLFKRNVHEALGSVKDDPMFKRLSEEYSQVTCTQEFNNWETFESIYLTGKSKIWVIRDKNQTVIASVGLTIKETHGEIVRLYVDQKHTRKGYGNMLMKTAVEHGLSNDCKKIILLTPSSNEGGIVFYKKMGFIEMGRHVFELQGKKTNLRILSMMYKDQKVLP
uniref:N-acetyltransferase domain-containing protein n=1 Tax=Mucochytrium quahogii TaxID=96639 RepID=A0A7S2WFT9_9STRA|mmetsp:Transcript_20185/g.33340  ORF Transcript_20185/g.33340 Transcript_20185/m.33340 type:complete len:176 (-) Transcript_20185:202-729(-)|eukprot:CAMPEP_0203771710 /NCGR_PEP_ID=MMETSP0099_2-20121227/3571_1 /ASSEMBLY_ACC=CAM_ASM_000209 /TAXON_ID=96639 /ORGANISM=" , Strain NY0313808BC1" /LENGTH=175 /DNA_ID=CAMNT_0050669095 /DNA_START=38 /DNA_END=565 /DNA_ORIENTATION=-